ncbi:MAG: hypothetical protein Q4F56_00750 [Candidatus Saccharibacteria bacterium]|nr:hypothetical protein [Candidatus Saccharibacteria bacterium]
MVEQHKDISYVELKSKIGQGWGWEEFESKFGISKTRLKRHIRQHLCQTENYARGIIRDIDNNSKRKRKQGQRSQAEAVVEVEPVEASSVEVKPAETEPLDLEPVEVKSERTSSKKAKDKDVAIVSSASSGTDQLAGLRWEEANQRKVLANLERKRKRLVNQLNDNFNKTHLAEVEYAQIEQALAAKSKECVQLIEEGIKLKASANDLLQKMDEAKRGLDNIHQQIADLETIKIFAYKDGTFESLNKDVVLDDAGYTELVEELASRDECQSLLVRDMNLVARLSRIVDHSDKRVEVTFENENLEQVFTKLHPAESSDPVVA